MTKRCCSDSLPLISSMISSKRVTFHPSGTRPSTSKKFLDSAFRIFLNDKDLKTTTEALFSLVSTLSPREASKVLHRRDSRDKLKLSNTLPHYVVFYYGKKMRLSVSDKERLEIGKHMFRLIQYVVFPF